MKKQEARRPLSTRDAQDAGKRAYKECVEAGGESTPVERARKILYGPCWCGADKKGGAFCAHCLSRLKQIDPSLNRAASEIELAESFLRYFDQALIGLSAHSGPYWQRECREFRIRLGFLAVKL